MLTKAHIIVNGEVQGIGYRYFAKRTATNYNIKGFVKNRADGSVELDIEGEKEEIEKYVKCLEHDHPWAKITTIESKFNAYEGKYKNFEIKL